MPISYGYFASHAVLSIVSNLPNTEQRRVLHLSVSLDRYAKYVLFLPSFILQFLNDHLGSRDSNPVRVFVERAPGVRDNEPVMRWNS